MTRATHGANLKLNTVPALKWAGGIATRQVPVGGWHRRPGWELSRGRPCECTQLAAVAGPTVTETRRLRQPQTDARPGVGPCASGPTPSRNRNLKSSSSSCAAGAGDSDVPVHIAPGLGASEASQAASFAAGAGDWGSLPVRVRSFSSCQAARIFSEILQVRGAEHAGDADRTFPIDGPLSSALSTKCQCTLRVRGRCIHCVTLACASRTGRGGCVQ